MARSGRGWGPFSGAQLTMMVCVIVAAVAFPVGAWAASSSKVFVADATSGSTAKVSAGGALTVAGTVTARDAGPDALVNFIGTADGATCTVIATPPSGKAWVLQSLSLNVFDDGGVSFGPDQYITVYPNRTCAYPYFAVATPSALGHQDFNLDPGVAIPNSGAVSVQLFTTNAGVEVQGRGYSVPSSAVPGASGITPKQPIGRTPDAAG